MYRQGKGFNNPLQLISFLLTASDKRFPESDFVLRNMFICLVMPVFPEASAEALLPVPPVEECIDRFPLPDPPVPFDSVPVFELPVPPLMTLKYNQA